MFIFPHYQTKFLPILKLFCLSLAVSACLKAAQIYMLGFEKKIPGLNTCEACFTE